MQKISPFETIIKLHFCAQPFTVEIFFYHQWTLWNVFCKAQSFFLILGKEGWEKGMHIFSAVSIWCFLNLCSYVQDFTHVLHNFQGFWVQGYSAEKGLYKCLGARLFLSLANIWKLEAAFKHLQLDHLSQEAQSNTASVILVQHSHFSSPISFPAAWLFLSSLSKLESAIIKCDGCYYCFMYMQGYYPDLLEERTPEMLYTDPCIFNTAHTHEGNRLNNALESWGIMHINTFCLYLPCWPLANKYAASPFLRGVPVMRWGQMLSCLPVPEGLHGASLVILNREGKRWCRVCLPQSMKTDSDMKQKSSLYRKVLGTMWGCLELMLIAG